MTHALSPVLLLDVMGTLVRDPFFEDMPAFFGLTLKELLAHKHPTAWVEFEHGAIDEAACMAKFFKDARAFDVAALKAHVARGYAWLPGVEPLLAELSAQGVEMHALSNYPPWWRLIEERLALSRYVRWTFVSCHTGVRKPAPEAYLGAASALGRPASSLVFVDDREGNVEGARRVGMPGLVFRDAETLRADLTALGIP
ncbi:MAG: HAD-IA family hydrolase [Deltaproteobacteria bacterium]|nr:HAD-IA family hydrolase [Deltaproteobacteria bacterium]